MPNSSDPLPLEFFVSPRCPPVPTTTGDTAVKAHPREVAKEPEGNSLSGTKVDSNPSYFLFLFEISIRGPVWPPEHTFL